MVRASSIWWAEPASLAVARESPASPEGHLLDLLLRSCLAGDLAWRQVELVKGGFAHTFVGDSTDVELR